MPYNPLLYDHFVKKVPIIKSVEIEIYKVFKDKEDITIIGSFNPNLNGLKNSDFYDQMHLSESGINKLLINYKNYQ